jgi:hypothetical protein
MVSDTVKKCLTPYSSPHHPGGGVYFLYQTVPNGVSHRATQTGSYGTFVNVYGTFVSVYRIFVNVYRTFVNGLQNFRERLQNFRERL